MGRGKGEVMGRQADEDQRDRDNQAYWRRVWAEQRAAEQRARLAAEAARREAER